MKIKQRPADCLYYLLSRATLAATNTLRHGFEAAGVERVNPAYLGALLCLWQKNGVGASELGRCAGLEPSTMTGLLDRMERDRLIIRAADPKDRRAQRVKLTSRGRLAQRPVMKVVDAALERITEGFSETEQHTMKEMLRRVLVNVKGDDYMAKEVKP
jgi:DNA-binding MarR family transcriptional regulator